MSFIGGYQSNFNFNALQLVGDLPIEHSIGGFGQADGTDNYTLVLTPSLTQYRPGLPLEVKFTHPNTTIATLDVDGQGPKSIKKIVDGVLTDVDPGDLEIYKVYVLIYDGTYFQLANFQPTGTILLPPQATVDVKGIAQLATSPELDAGLNDTKIITPAKLATYIANKLTGLMQNKGLIDCSLNPLYPAGVLGDSYTVSVGGKIGGPDGIAVTVRAIIYCNATNPGGTQLQVGGNWNVLQSTQEQATELIAGLARIALQAEVDAGVNNDAIVTPLKLKTNLDARLATELLTGLAEIATQAEVNAGLDDSRIVTPAKLKTLLSASISLANEVTAGTSRFATLAEVLNGLDNTTAVTPAKLAAYVAGKVTGLWKNKGLLDCSTQPDYPAGQAGDAYSISVAGKIGGAGGQNVGVKDVMYCITDTPGGAEAVAGASWNIVQANLEQASEALAGYMRIAMQSEVNSGLDDSTLVTPLKLKTLLDNRLASETISGMTELATQDEVNVGTDDLRIVTPLKLKTLLNTTVVPASETQVGIARLATAAEVNNGQDNNTLITPAKLAAYVAGKVTGLWKDKGLLDCSTFPNYPAALTGEAYTVATAGKIGGALGQNVGVKDIIYCNQDAPVGDDATVGSHWTILQSNLEQATEVLAGYARIALQAEVNAGLDNATIVTPLKLKTLLDNRQATELVLGLLEIATQDEVTAGVDDLRAVTPLKLITLLNGQLLFKPGVGLNSIVPKNGLGNIAPGAYGAVLNGSSNAATGNYSLAMGLLANALLFNEAAKASGGFYNTQGSAQYSVLNLFNIIPAGALAYPLALDGNGLSAVNRWTPPINCIQAFSAQVTVVHNSGTGGTPGDSWIGIFEGAVKNKAGVLSWVGAQPTLRGAHEDAGFFPTISFALNGAEVRIQVDGMVNRSLHANVTVQLSQTKFSLG